ERSCLTIVLAAGEGTRMKSRLPKVLHKIAGLEMVAHVLGAARRAGSRDVALVVGHGGTMVRDSALAFLGEAEIFTQEERLGTAHAALQARSTIGRGYDDVLVLFGDTPLLEPGALAAIRAELASGLDAVVMGFRTDRPAGYGRLIEKDGVLAAIRE